MQLSQACKIMHGELSSAAAGNAAFFGAATDTRLLNAGQLFFAWKGQENDGHFFLEQAAAKGATAAVVERFHPHINLPQIKVNNSQQALGLLAQAWRQEWKGSCIAVTGSNGKTTLKEMLKSIHQAHCELENNQQSQITASDKVHATYGNLNNHIGCPLTLLALKPEHRFAIIEMGANHHNEITYLTKITLPDIAILNNAGSCHLEGFGSVAGVAKAKAEIFQGLRADGVAIINADDAFFKYWKSILKTTYYSFGCNKNADVYADNIHNNYFSIHFPNQTQVDIHLQLEGQHNISNAVAAAAASFANKIPLAAIKQGLESLVPVKGRLQKINLTANISLINDSYNANPSSLKAGIDAIKSSQKWLVLGDMKELGDDAIYLHESSGRYAKDQQFSRLFTLGDLSFSACNGFGEGALHSQSHEQLATSLIKAIKEYSKYNDKTELSILIKGSFSMNMGKIIEQLTKEFSCSTH